MKLTFKIYQQPDADFEIDAEPSETVGDLKAKIKDSKGHDVEKQNIIFCGKGLANDRTLESYRINGKGFLVLSMSKPRPPLPVPRQLNAEEYFALSEKELAHFPLGPPPTASASGSENTPALVSSPTSASTFKYIPMSSSAPIPPTTSVSSLEYVLASSSSSAPVSATTSSPLPTTSTSTFKYVPMSSSAPVPPATSVSTFKYIPLSASSSAPIPAATSAPVPPTTSASACKSVQVSSSDSASGRAPASTSTSVPSSISPAGQPSRSTATLQQGRALGARITNTGRGDSANDPQITAFRQLVTQNPEFRQHFIQQLAQEDPELGQLLTRNPDLLLQFLDRIGEDGDASSGGAQAVRASVSEAERAAIERLEGLGFPRQAVVEAYFACDKNEELAANYLLEHS